MDIQIIHEHINFVHFVVKHCTTYFYFMFSRTTKSIKCWTLNGIKISPYFKKKHWQGPDNGGLENRKYLVLFTDRASQGVCGDVV